MGNQGGFFDLPNQLMYCVRMTQDERIINIESSISHIEQLLESLNQTIIEQDKTIQQMQVQLTKLATNAESQEMDKIKSTIKKPPHYP